MLSAHTNHTMRLLLVDDEEDALTSLKNAIQGAGFTGNIDLATTADKALGLVAKSDYHVAVLDLCLDGSRGVGSGFELLCKIIKDCPYVRCIMLTGHASVTHGIQALQKGAAHFLEKPASIPHLLALIHDSGSQSLLRREYDLLKHSHSLENLSSLVGVSQKFEEVRKQIFYVAGTGQAVLITGETGTGKGVCALAIHKLSPRKEQKFVRYQPNFGTADLIYSDLFGHLKGAFTGAQENRKGLLLEAHQGTLFLDEIDELPSGTQVSLLGVLQDKKFRPVGANKEEEANFRLISATNQDVDLCLKEGKLRQDFYHRIAHQRIHILPLRDRKEDIPILSSHFLRLLGEREKVNVLGIEEEALTKLSNFDWPGNVRQLEAVIEGAAYKAAYENRRHIKTQDIQLAEAESDSVRNTFQEQAEHFKITLIEQALSRHAGNQAKAALELGLDRSSLRRIWQRRRK